ncbi:MAG TPA: long-chain fatty acid--CoA ligase [Pyrinomonadaceae bacterium]|nr:long-chain fatty acid--CoA ligase [Pyrinomonadaceae bacterium]
MSDNVRQLLEQRVAAYGNKPFLFSETDGRQWTYAEFDHSVNGTANLLLANGIAKGDVVSLLMPNSPEYIIAYFACWKIGAIAGPVNSLLKSEEIEWVVNNSESKLLLSEPPASAGGTGDATTTTRFGIPNVALDLANLPAADASGSDIFIDPDDDAIIIYTSGTTGKPKGCLLTHGNLLANAQQIAEWMGFGEDDRLLTVMPLFHMNAVSVTTMTALYAGGSTVVSPKFSASRFWDIIEKYKITSFGSVATMLSMLLQKNAEFGIQNSERNPKSKIQNPKSLRFAMCGSAPVPAEVLNRFEETFGVLVIEGYGLSESTCRSTFNPPNKERRPGSCGKPIGNEMAIFNENDEPQPDGELGEIVLRGPNICKGYFKNPYATETAFANGWFHTGDIGYRDADGFYYIADRKSDMIIRGGENIYPREIDDVLYTHPAVAAAACIGVPDDLYGEEVAAFIVLKAETRSVGSVPAAPQVTEQDIINFCKQHLADYKCPKTVHFLDDIPKGPTGKLLKRELAKLVTK